MTTTSFLVLKMTSFALLISINSGAVIQSRIQEPNSTPEPWSSSKDSSGERVRRQYPYNVGGYGNYGAYNGMYNSMYGGYGGYSPYNYAGYTGYQYPYTNGIFPLQGGYYPGSIVGSGSIWAAGGGLVGNMLSFLVG